MDYFDNFEVKVKNLKCFATPEQGFEKICSINLIIGRNNSGKSSLLNLIEYLIKNKNDFPQSMWHSGIKPEIIATAPLTEGELKSVFPENTSGGEIPGNHWGFGKKLTNALFSWQVGAPNGSKYVAISASPDGSRPFETVRHPDSYLQRIADRKTNPFLNKEFNTINAERNIQPEGDSAGNLNVSGISGTGPGFVFKSK
jgi:energy-coupling factor transporter ATP-binding protein EcfA2